MKIVFDTDGTLTDYNNYVTENAISYFERKYGMEVKYPTELEIEDVFDMGNFFKDKHGCDSQEAKMYTESALNKYWISPIRFIKFFVLERFRNGAADFVNSCKKNGHRIEIHTARAKSAQRNVVGAICRVFTYFQYIFNGVYLPYRSYHFYKNDTEKTVGIINSNPQIAFDDKPIIIEQLSERGIKTVCIKGSHNQSLEENACMRKINGFNKCEIEKALDALLGRNSYKVLNRIAKSDLVYKRIRKGKSLVLLKFRPIILHKENIVQENYRGCIIAPNHRSTLDPIVVTSIIDQNIHWVALKRFFNAEDSIFNNSKSPILCKITAKLFKALEYFPIERLRDNPKANNLRAIKDMQLFLGNHQCIGIFPEGTTSRPQDADFGVFDPAFIALAKRNNAWIQPITILWIKEVNIPQKLIVNFGEPFKVSQLSKEEAYDKYVSIQIKQLEENKCVLESLKEDHICANSLHLS